MTASKSEPAAAGDRLQAASLAKVNLTLRVIGRRTDGYHLLESLVVFPAIGDFIEIEPARSLSLTLDGPQGFALDAGPENLVLRAALALRREFALPEDLGASIRLEKRLPVAGGIGGGSANAATTLRLLSQLWGVEASPSRLAAIGLEIGADVPACLGAPQAQMMRGIGERLSAAPPTPPFWLALVNPGVAVPTGEVFRKLDGRFSAPPAAPPESFSDFCELASWLEEARNDLEPAAKALSPEIGDVLAEIGAQPGCALARMSGSGGTCFGLFQEGDAAMRAAATIGAQHPAWWNAAGPVE